MKTPPQPNRRKEYEVLLDVALHITDESVAEFKALVLKEHGIELDDARARDVGSRLLRLYLCKQYWEELKQQGMEHLF